MALHEATDPALGRTGASDRPGVEWLTLGLAVYGWTDRRDPAVDHAWWRMQRVRIYRPAAVEERAREDAPAMVYSSSMTCA